MNATYHQCARRLVKGDPWACLGWIKITREASGDGDLISWHHVPVGEVPAQFLPEEEEEG